MGRVMERAMMPLPIDPKPIDEALQPLDRVAVEMEGKWGVGRLQRLVTPELAAKFGSAKSKLDEAIRANDLEAVVAKAAVLIRGWQALDKAATEAGHKQYPEAVWSAKHRGTVYTICLDRADVNKVAKDAADPAHVVTVAELLTVWETFQGNRVISATKEAFPGATVERAGIKDLDDDIPWN